MEKQKNKKELSLKRSLKINIIMILLGIFSIGIGITYRIKFKTWGGTVTCILFILGGLFIISLFTLSKKSGNLILKDQGFIYYTETGRYFFEWSDIKEIIRIKKSYLNADYLKIIFKENMDPAKRIKPLINIKWLNKIAEKKPFLLIEPSLYNTNPEKLKEILTNYRYKSKESK